MADKCFDVICLSCDREWCLLGCAFNDKPSKEKLDEYNKYSKNWADKYSNGNIRHSFATNEVCVCGSKEVAHK